MKSIDFACGKSRVRARALMARILIAGLGAFGAPHLEARGSVTQEKEQSAQSAQIKGSAAEAPVWHAILPHHVRLHSGGYLGLLAVGVGYDFFDDLWRHDALYGFVPTSVAGHDVHSFTYRTDIAMRAHALSNVAPAVRWLPAYFGGGVIYTPMKETHARLPEKYPGNYYPSTALHFTLHLGTEFQFLGKAGDAPRAGTVRRHVLVAELNMHEMSWLALYDNPKYFEAADLLTYSFGYKAVF